MKRWGRKLEKFEFFSIENSIQKMNSSSWLHPPQCTKHYRAERWVENAIYFTSIFDDCIRLSPFFSKFARYSRWELFESERTWKLNQSAENFQCEKFVSNSIDCQRWKRVARSYGKMKQKNKTDKFQLLQLDSNFFFSLDLRYNLHATTWKQIHLSFANTN